MQGSIGMGTFFCKTAQVGAQAYPDEKYSAGDAAHSFPPTGGLGLNSGLGDVHNLAFKLAYVLKDDAPDSFLDTYEVERRQVALVNSAQSVKNGQKIFNLLKTMGSTGENIVEARANLYARIADTKNRRAIDEGIEDQREHFDNVSGPGVFQVHVH